MSIPALVVHSTIRNQEARKAETRPVTYVPYGTNPRPVAKAKPKHGRRRSAIVYKTNWKHTLTLGLFS